MQGALPFVRIITMKLKKSQAAGAQENSKVAGGGAFISSRHRNPMEELATQSSAGKDKVGGICAILATVFLAMAAFLLYSQLGV